MPADSSPLDQSRRLPVRQHPHQGLPLVDGHWGASDEGLQPGRGDAGEKRDLIQGPTAAAAGDLTSSLTCRSLSCGGNSASGRQLR